MPTIVSAPSPIAMTTAWTTIGPGNGETSSRSHGNQPGGQKKSNTAENSKKDGKSKQNHSKGPGITVQNHGKDGKSANLPSNTTLNRGNQKPPIPNG